MKIKDGRTKTITEASPLRLNEFQVVINILPLDGDESKSIIILQNVSERKQAEEALKESEVEPSVRSMNSVASATPTPISRARSSDGVVKEMRRMGSLLMFTIFTSANGRPSSGTI